MHICTFLNPHTLENKFEGAFNDFARLHPPIKKRNRRGNVKWVEFVRRKKSNLVLEHGMELKEGKSIDLVAVKKIKSIQLLFYSKQN